MKKILSFVLVSFTVVSFALINTSCSTDPCDDVVCLNNGIPTESGDDCFCSCTTGYEGSDCGTLVRAKYLGNYNGTENCDTGNFTYSLTVAPKDGGTDLDVQFNNLYDQGLFVNGVVNAQGEITIPQQSFGNGQISGTAKKLSASQLEVTFTVTLGGVSDGCVAVFNK